MKAFVHFAVVGAFLLAHSAEAAIVTFDDVVAPNDSTISPYDSGGLTFSSPYGMFVWDGSSPNSNTTNNLIFTFFDTDPVTITRTRGVTFDLSSIDLAMSFYTSGGSDTVLFNNVAQVVDTNLTTYALNLTGITSFTISGLSQGGYWTADNVVFNVPTVPVPAALPLMLSALGGLGLMARRRRVTGV